MKLYIGENIKQLRGELSLTQEQLAGRLGCTAQAVSKWENGTTAPDIIMLPLLAQALGVTIDTLFAPCRTPYRHRGERLLAAYESDRSDEESYRAAKAEYEKRLHENDPDDHMSYAYLHEMRGWQYLKKAEAGYTRAFELGSDKALRQRIQLLRRQSRDGENIEACRALLVERPDDVYAHIALAMALCTPKEEQSAWDVARNAMERFPPNAILLCFAGHIRQALGEHAHALELWQQAYEVDNEISDALYSIACLYSDTGDKENARAAWQAVIDWLVEHGFDSCSETAWPREMLAKAQAQC